MQSEVARHESPAAGPGAHIGPALAPAGPTRQVHDERVRTVEAFALSMSLRQGFGFSQAWTTSRRGCLVKVTTDDGSAGWGECFGPAEPIAATVSHLFAPLVSGRAVGEIDVIWERCFAAVRDYGQKGLATAAISGIDIALHDLLGRALGVPVHVLLGGAFRLSVRAYASGLYFREDFDDPPAYVEEAQRHEEAGFSAVKMKVGRGVEADARVVAAVRGALAPETELMVDANHAYDARGAIRLGRRLEGVAWFEEPVPPEDLDGYREVRAALDTAVAGGEAECTRFGFRELIGRRCVDVVQPDTCLAGGLSEARRILALATAHGVRYMPHVWGTALTVATNLHLLASLPDQPGGLRQLPPLLELDQSEHPFRAEVVDEAPEAIDGEVAVPTGPGLGVDVDEEWVRAHALPL